MNTKLLKTISISILLSILLLPLIVKANAEKKEKTDSTVSTNPNENCIDEFIFGETIRGFTLVDADTNTDIFKMKEGGVIDIDTYGNRNLNIRVDQIDNAKISVDFVLTGPINRTWTENVVPHALFGDISGNYNGVKLPTGDYHLEATAYVPITDINSTSINFSVGKDTNTVTSFNLISAERDLNFDGLSKEYYINDGQDFDTNSYPFAIAGNPVEVSINAITNSYATGSVSFELNGPLSYSRTENVAPYTLFGDFEGDFYGQLLPVGRYTLIATPYGDANKQGKKGIPLAIKFFIADNVPNISLQEMQLVNAETDTRVLYINQYQNNIIDNKETPTDNVNIAVFPGYGSDTIGSVFLALEGPVSYSQTENFEPYAIFGDISGNYYGRSLGVGSYKLTAIPYTGPNRTGQAGVISFYDFEVIDTSDATALKTVLYPNPSSSITSIRTEDARINFKAVILDMAGIKVMELPKNWKSEQPIDISGLKKGLYFVKITNGKERITKKLVVQ